MRGQQCSGGDWQPKKWDFHAKNTVENVSKKTLCGIHNEVNIFLKYNFNIWYLFYHQRSLRKTKMSDVSNGLHRDAFWQFFFGGFITAIVVNPPERKLAKRTSVDCVNRFYDRIRSLSFFLRWRTCHPQKEGQEAEK